MDYENFELIWENNLRDDFHEKEPGMFLRASKQSHILHARLHSHAPADSPVPSHDSEATIVDQGDKQRLPCSSICMDINDSRELYECQSAPYRTKFFLIEHVGNSFSAFNITRDLFLDLTTAKTPNAIAFSNLISHMGGQQRDETSPPPPYWHRFPAANSYGLELGYALRYPVEHKRSLINPWSIRQFATQFSSTPAHIGEETTWVFLALPRFILQNVVLASSRSNVPSGASAVSAHLYLFEQMLAYWRGYIGYLQAEIEQCNGDITFAAPDGETEADLPQIRLRLRNLENQLEDSKVSISANHQVLKALTLIFTSLSEGGHNDDLCKTRLTQQIAYHEVHSDNLLSQLSSLQNKLASCTQIASSFLKLSNGKALKNIATSSALEAQKTGVLAEQNHRDAATVKALTVIASVFLPTTVVLNFFSTSFVEAADNSVRILRNWWLFLAVGVPLTLITLIIWGVWMWFQLRRTRHRQPSCCDEDSC